MKQLNLILSLILFSFMTACSSVNNPSRIDLIELEKKNYSIILDSIPIQLSQTYLNNDNISKIIKDNKKRIIHIIRKNKASTFYSIEDLKLQNKYPSDMQYITVNGLVLDSLEISKTKFENGSIKYIRFLTQKDYQGKEFDDLPQVKQSVGKGILIINTE